MLIQSNAILNPYINDVRFDFKNPLKIKGSVKKTGINLPCRVLLYDRVSNQLVADKLTDNSGNFEFNHLSKMVFFIVAHDPASQFNAVIQDNVVPK